MGTNRTKIDWAYRKAINLRDITVDNHMYEFRGDGVRRIAAALRAAFRKGRKVEQEAAEKFAAERP